MLWYDPCRWPFGFWGCAACAELRGLERDSAGSAWSHYIWAGLCRAQKPGSGKGILHLGWGAKLRGKKQILGFCCLGISVKKHICGFYLQAVTMAGDGYKGRTSPHTPNEKFEGATVLKTLQVHQLLSRWGALLVTGDALTLLKTHSAHLLTCFKSVPSVFLGDHYAVFSQNSKNYFVF